MSVTKVLRPMSQMLLDIPVHPLTVPHISVLCCGPGCVTHPFSLLLVGPVQEKMEMVSLPPANERRPCVLVGRDNMALPASLISQIGYRCHPSLYTEGDPGEKVELVAGRTRDGLTNGPTGPRPRGP